MSRATRPDGVAGQHDDYYYHAYLLHNRFHFAKNVPAHSLVVKREYSPRCTRLAQRGRVADAVMGIVFIITIFGIVVLHELGHALAARRYGIRTRDITLLPIGGVARLERMPEDPRQELVVALAGPAVNVALAVALLFLVLPTMQFDQLGRVHVFGGTFLLNLFLVNVWMAAFNLIPAFPMDGGRVLRALLAMRFDYVRATQVAAGIGQFLALGFVVAGLLLPNPFLLFIALFVWLGAAGEASMVQMKNALGGIPIRQVMITNYQTLAPNDPLSRAVEHILAGFQQDFPVVDGDRVVGVLTRADLLAALAQRGTGALVGEVMQRDFMTADPAEMAETVFNRLQECNCHSLPVVQNGRLIGILTADNVGEFLMIQAALRKATPPKLQFSGT
ncbi:MAG: site-2 protease family protein [Verrucomicrobiae bacterium]|nr:site-2 protease family protein [Verrucomicrobiae bacterium]